MKRIILLALLLAGTAMNTMARDGYHIQVKIPGVKDSMVYLAHYYGLPLPKIYKSDSARFDKNGVAVIKSDKELLGGIYVILLSDMSTLFEVLLNNGDEFNVSVKSKSDIPVGLTFKNSPENDRFMEYQKFLRDYGEKYEALKKSAETAKNHADTMAIDKKMKALSKTLQDYRHDYTQQYPRTILASVFNALDEPVVPEGKHYLPDGKEDSTFAYHYFKDHYWDKFDFTDDRLINTPLYDGKLDQYINKMVVPIPDSIEKEADMLLAKTRGSKELFHYTLWYLEYNAEHSKIMGMDAAVVYLIEKYYMKGDAYWLHDTDLQKYIKYASKIAPNVIGNKAPEIKLVDINNVEHRLSDIKAKYTLLVFWSPECGHCQHEIPVLDSVYKAVLKPKGVKVMAIKTEGDEKKWKEFIEKNDLKDWIHVYDPANKSDYRAKYDIYSTPVLYLLDENKIIRGKRIDHTNIANVLEMVEKKEKADKEKQKKKTY
ncbi:MAG: thioredoxin-like domain-containing protein [Bacteroidota bacterium]